MLGYSGFLRYDELSHIEAKHISVYETHAEVLIEKSKTDTHRQGSVVVIARTKTDSCPVAMLEKYLKFTNIDLCPEQYIFRSVTFLKSKNSSALCKQNKPLSYTRAREIVLEALEQLRYDKKQFGLHSLRSGGVTAAASNSVPDRLLKSHGRWKSDKSKDGYIKESFTNKLFVSMNLGI